MHKVCQSIFMMISYILIAAGDQMKYGFPFAHSMIFLAWSMIDYKTAYANAGEWENGLDSIRWGTDWILKVGLYTGLYFLFTNPIFKPKPFKASVKVDQNTGELLR